MQIIMAARHSKQTLIPVKFLNNCYSKISPFHLFIFLIGLPIGFVCSFYLQSFSVATHTIIFSLFRSISLLSRPSSTLGPTPVPALAPASAPPPLDTISSLTSPLPPTPPVPVDTISSLTSPPPAPVDTLSSLTFPLPPPQPSPLPLTSSLTQPPLSLPHANSLSVSPSSYPPPAPPPLSLESIPSPTPSSSLLSSLVNEQIPMMHNMSDQDLVKSVMEVSTKSAMNASYKVAFMFLTPGPLPLSPLWELFFKGHKDLFSIYVHTHPSYNDIIPQDSVFYGRRISSQPVYWGDISMVDAERRLLANALLDPLNQRFVLLSDSCIPLFNFTTTYNYLVNSNLSFINSFDDKRKSGRGRYNPQMSPNITIEDWRKGSQWFEVNRDLALEIVFEQKYYTLFKDFCHPPCYNDEHYLPTMVNILYGRLNSNRSITYVDWSIVGPHPRKFGGGEINEELLNSIRFGSSACVYNGYTTPMCVLFARKFAPRTLKPLLTFATLLFSTN